MEVSKALKAFLDLIAHSEGTASGLDSGYGVIVSGTDGAHSFTDYSAHPFANGRPPIEVVAPGARFPKGLYSTASGRYQIILPTWKSLALDLELRDFTPTSQDAAAIELVVRRGAVASILTGDIQDAIILCSNEWASLPGNSYGQGGHSMGTLLAKYVALMEACDEHT
jgi:muramidase (phage lysozyme)